VIAMCVGCSADPCAVLCKETAVALDTCMDEWSITWEHLDAAGARDFRDRCTNRWGGVRSKLVAREIEDARDQWRANSNTERNYEAQLTPLR